MKWSEYVEKVENGGSLGSPRQNFWPLPKRAAGSASVSGAVPAWPDGPHQQTGTSNVCCD